MSIEPEDSLEEALRADLPSPRTEARLRRRLLGAGLAVGNGLAASSALAGGGAGTVAKVLGLSWGVKVGLAAALAIPGVGLWWESVERGSAATSAATSAAPREHRPGAAAPEPRAVPQPELEPELEPERAVESPRPRALARREEPSPPPVTAAPSRTEFAPPEAAAPRAPSVESTLREETRLLDRAFAELSAGNRDAARRLIAEHESRYPSGLLVKERERAKLKLSELSRGE